MKSLVLPVNSVKAAPSPTSTNEIVIEIQTECKNIISLKCFSHLFLNQFNLIQAQTTGVQHIVNQSECSPLIVSNSLANYNNSNATITSTTTETSGNITKVTLFVANLPCHLNQTEYENILMNKLSNDTQLKWTECEAVYSKYGAAVIYYADRELAAKAYELLIKDSTHENNKLKVFYLPSIQVNFEFF